MNHTICIVYILFEIPKEIKIVFYEKFCAIFYFCYNEIQGVCYIVFLSSLNNGIVRVICLDFYLKVFRLYSHL